MPYANYVPEEVAARGDAIYEEKIRDQVEAAHHGEFVVIDIETEDFELHENDGTASKRLLARRPDGVLYGLRIGASTAYHLLGQWRR